MSSPVTSHVIVFPYLPQMPDETRRRYLSVAIAPASRRVFLHIYPDQGDGSRTDSLRRLK